MAGTYDPCVCDMPVPPAARQGPVLYAPGLDGRQVLNAPYFRPGIF